MPMSSPIGWRRFCMNEALRTDSNRMPSALVYVEHRDGQVLPITYELLGAARGIATAGGDVACCVFGADPENLVGQLAGADRILLMRHPALSPYNPEAHAVALQSVVQSCSPDVLLLAYSSVGLDLGSVVAIRTSLPFVCYCTALQVDNGALEAASQLHGGKLVAKTRTPLPAIAAVVPGSFDESSGKIAGRAEVMEMASPEALTALRIRFISASAPDTNQIDLTKCERIVCVGRGIGAVDRIAIASDLAASLDAEIAGSRPVIDAGWLPKMRQVGKSGQTVKPKLYIAVGVSGAPEHLEGMKGADCIVAINTDAKAPIFEVAHIGTTCDLFELLPALNERIRKS
jgi:electron transfer flavoprotein alpha subunit